MCKYLLKFALQLDDCHQHTTCIYILGMNARLYQFYPGMGAVINSYVLLTIWRSSVFEFWLLKIFCFTITNFPFVCCYSCFDAVHGLEYGYGAHDYSTSGVFEVEPRSCPGFIFRRSVLLGSTDMSHSEVRSFMEHISEKYHGDSYHLIAKNCNHFADEVCLRLTGKPIPGWVNRLARVGEDHDGLSPL